MTVINIKETLVSPKTILDKEIGLFEISGSSYMSNPLAHYSVVINWLEKYLEDPLPKTHFIFNLEYSNTATVKLINEIIILLVKLKQQGKELQIDWYYGDDDEDSLDIGKQFSNINKFPFNFILRED